MQIYKYQMHLEDRCVIAMPGGAKVLSVQPQGEFLCLWALCDERQPLTNRKFAIYDTGQQTPELPGNYIATIQIPLGPVFHVFEI